MASRTAIALSAFLLFALFSALPARAVSLTIAGPTSGPVTSGTGLELIPTPASQVTITFGLNVATSINGYDVTIAWDPTEVSLAGDTQLFPSGMPPDTLLFTVAADPTSSAGTRVATISLTAFTTTSLFSLTFNLGALVQDGAPDVRIFVDAMTNGAGLAPGSVLLENDSGAGLDLAPLAVPEPASAALALSGFTLLFARRRRRARPGARAPCFFRCLTVFLAILLLTSSSLTAHATTPDADGDVVPDYCDNCRMLPNRGQSNAGSDNRDSCVIPAGQTTGACKAKPGVACTKDADCALPVTGDACDCDFDDDGDCDADDYGDAFLPDFTTGMSLTAGTDMDGSGTVNIDDFNLFLMGHASGAPGPGATAANAVNRNAAGVLSMGTCWNERVGPLFASASDGCSLSPAVLAPLGFPADGNVNNPADAVVSSFSFGLLRCPNTSFGTFEKPGAVCGIDVDVSICDPIRAGIPCGPAYYCRVSPAEPCASDADCTTVGTRCFVGHCNPDPPKSCLEDVDCGTGFKCIEMFCGDVHNPRPCEKHDDIICGYRGIEKNNQFRRDLFAVCNALTGVERDACYAVCLVYAKAFADAIDFAGDDDGVWTQPELDQQRRACDCCQDPGPGGEPPPVCGDGRCDEWAESCEVGSCPEDCGNCDVGDACHVDADCPGMACLPDGKCGRLPAFSACQSNSMCRSGSCFEGACVQGCGDGFCDGTEACGASDFLFQCNADCGRCAPGQFCLTDPDCANDTCNFNVCLGAKLPGGSGCSTNNACLSGACNFGFCLDTPLPALSPCTTGAACKSGSCPLGLCAQICNDGFCDGLEKCGDVNGGLECIDDCGKCGSGELCTSNDDCTTGICNLGFCIGSPLPALFPCTTDVACKNGSCPAGFCAQICNDGFCDGLEKCGDANAGLECTADCGKCSSGELCTSNGDCASAICNFGFCIPNPLPPSSPCTTNAACTGGICNFGFCIASPLPTLSPCTTNAACTSGICNLGFCIAGPLPALSPCTTDVACKSGSCPAGLCAQICNDGFCDGLEKCGDGLDLLKFECPADCGKCSTGELCTSNGDCASAICNFGFCIASPLPALSPCTTNAACRSGSCPVGLCAQICNDGFCDGTEQCGNVNAGIECNADCSTCGNGHTCTQNADCTSGACNFLFCVGAGSVGVGGACSTAAACSNNICEVLCCGRPFLSGCTQNSDCCSNNCASFLGIKSCALFASASQSGSSDTGSTGEGTKKKPAPKKTKPAKATKKP